MHGRSRLAFDAAVAAGRPGRFVVLEHSGLLATLTTAPGLQFLNVVAGVCAGTVDDVPDVLARYPAAPPTLLVTDPDDAVDDRLRGWGFQRAGPRPIALLDLTAAACPPAGGSPVEEVDNPHDLEVFLDVLGAGYDASEAVTAFMRAEHDVPALRKFMARADDEPIAVGAMSVHEGVAVLGGAAVLPAHRGLGRQVPLLRHRIGAARTAGCHAAVATAAPDSASLRNLVRAGFDVHLRQAWRPMVATSAAGPESTIGRRTR